MTESKIELPKTDFAYVFKVDVVNYKPHIFMIGPQHFPKDGSIYLKPEQAPCAMSGCYLDIHEHTSDQVAFIKLTRNTTQTEMQAWLVELTKPDGWALTLKPRPIDGFAFIKTEFDFIVDEPVFSDGFKGTHVLP